MAPGLRLSAAPPRLRRALPWVALALACLALLTARVVWSAREELALGRAAYDRGDRQAAVLHLRYAAHWYAPGNAYVTAALEELRQIGRQAEMEGQVDLALSAYRAIRTSCLGTRSLYVPHRQRLYEANQRIAALLARQPPPPMDRAKSVSQRRAEHLAELERLEQPNPFWSLAACLAFLAWVGAAFGAIFHGLDGGLRLRSRPAARWAAAFALAFIAWVVSLLLA